MDISLRDVMAARQRIAPHLPRTPLLMHPVLARDAGCDLWLKHENYNPTGAFKIRGGLNYMGSLSAEDRRRGVITATRGNHGLSIAWAARLYRVPATIVVPYGNNPEKNEAIRAIGAELIEFGRDFDEARVEVERLQHERGARYIHSANEPLLIAGVATYALEIFEDLPDVEVAVVPVGGGSGVCGVLTVARALGSKARVIGVQAERADAVYKSWKSGQRVENTSADTIADGLATRVTFDLTFDIMRRLIDDIVTLTEADLAEGVRVLLRSAHTLAEAAGAASTAAVLKLRDQMKGKKVVAVVSGANIDTALLRTILNEEI